MRILPRIKAIILISSCLFAVNSFASDQQKIKRIPGSVDSVQKQDESSDFSEGNSLERLEYIEFHRKALDLEPVLMRERSLDVDAFLQRRSNPNAVVLDVRNKKAYMRKHVEGALHLQTSDITHANLEKIIPSKNTEILIYCDNSLMSELTRRMSLTDLSMPLIYQFGYENVYKLQDGTISKLKTLNRLPMISNANSDVGVGN